LNVVGNTLEGHAKKAVYLGLTGFLLEAEAFDLWLLADSIGYHFLPKVAD
jgi:hypothetical protein